MTAAQDQAAIARRVRRGVASSGLIVIVERIWIFALGIATARLLVPEQFAAFAAGLTIVMVLVSIDDFGVMPTLVHDPRDFDDLAPTGALVAAVSGLLLYGLIFVSAPFLASRMGLSGEEGVFRILTLTVITDALAIAPNSLLMRDLRPERRGYVAGARLIVRTVVMVVIALQVRTAVGMAWAFAAGELTALVAAYVFTRFRPRFGFDRQVFGRFVRYGVPLAISSFVALGTFTVDNFIVGGRLGAAALGYYLVAFNIATWPVNIIGGSLTYIAGPAFAAYRRDGHHLGAFISRSIIWTMELALPITALLIGLASPLVLGLFGEQWEPSIRVVEAIATLGLARLLVNLGRDAFAAGDLPKAIVAIQFAWLVLVCILVTAGTILGGITGAAWGHVVAASVISVATLLVLKRTFQVRLRSFLELARPIAGAVAAGGLSWLAAETLDTAGASPFIQIPVGAALGLAAYAIIGLSASRRRELLESVPARRARSMLARRRAA